LPESAIQFEGESTYVLVKEGEEFVRKDVVTGISNGIDVEIKEGVAEGEKVRGAQVIMKKK
ncbi:MAG: efflux transporter periplasmic adaptor subunit, partial [Bacteroidales bacterium]|nr:efflux transporter periplasmic adaptor subunit [Bacteroidales bacterium]